MRRTSTLLVSAIAFALAGCAGVSPDSLSSTPTTMSEAARGSSASLAVLEELGEDFDWRDFHDAVLLSGPVPLEILEENIDRWIAAQKAE